VSGTIASLTYLLLSRRFNLADEAVAVAASERMLAEHDRTPRPTSTSPR
jgi:hypothetical protein